MNRLLLFIYIFSVLTSSVDAFADCNSACSNTTNQSTQIKAACLALAQDKKAQSMDEVLTGIDGAIVLQCGLACAGVSGLLGPAVCQGLGALDSAADLVGSFVLAYGPQGSGAFPTGAITDLMSGGMALYQGNRDRKNLSGFKQLAKEEQLEKQKQMKNGACMTAVFMAVNLIQRGMSIKSDTANITSGCDNINNLLATSPNPTFAFGSGASSPTPDLGAVAAASVGGSGVAGAPLDVLQGATRGEQSAAASAGGVGGLLSSMPHGGEGFAQQVANGQSGAAIADLFPSGVGNVGSDLGAIAQAAQDQGLTFSGLDPGFYNYDSFTQLGPVSGTAYGGSAAVGAPVKEEVDPLARLLDLLKPDRKPAEASGGTTSLLQLQRSRILNVDIFHGKTHLNLFEIVSRRIESSWK